MAARDGKVWAAVNKHDSLAAVIVRLDISSDEMLRWYKGKAQDVLAYSVDGRRVRFPASVLQPFVTRQGINGYFRILFDSNHKLKGVERID